MKTYTSKNDEYKTKISRIIKAEITKRKVVSNGDEGDDGEEGCGVLVICSVLWLAVKSGCRLRVDDVDD